MFLNNKLFQHGICNGTIGVITKVFDDDNVEVAFPTHENIVKINVQREITYFSINGIPASRMQFPIQNAFALTVHKTQSLTLPHSTVSVDGNMFAMGQIYMAMSRTPLWDSIDMLSFDFDCVKVDKNVIEEYRRLNFLSQKGLKETNW